MNADRLGLQNRLTTLSSLKILLRPIHYVHYPILCVFEGLGCIFIHPTNGSDFDKNPRLCYRF
jgi:hypothetical protein